MGVDQDPEEQPRNGYVLIPEQELVLVDREAADPDSEAQCEHGWKQEQEPIVEWIDDVRRPEPDGREVGGYRVPRGLGYRGAQGSPRLAVRR